MEQDTTVDSTFNGKNQHREQEHDDMQVQVTHSPLRRYTSNPSEVVIKVESGSSSWHGAGRKLSNLKPGSKRRRSSYNVRRSSLKERQEDDLHMEILASDIADDDAKKIDVKTTAAGDDGRCLRCCMIIVIVFMIVAFLGTGGFFLVSLLSSECYGAENERLEVLAYELFGFDSID
ncbi:uncharacterized protein [Diadema antillarum]|uniref:uncharacterized protein isoform X1 n=1 Tax=Diadema antillarum TaxID=105358 RepID=UPI003A874AE4